MSAAKKKIVIGISGASGMIYATRLLKAIPEEYQLHVVISEVAKKIMKSEVGWDISKVTFEDFWKKTQSETIQQKNIQFHKPDNHYAAVASGSFPVEGMVIMPCSVKTLSGVANGYANTLIERAADVNLKENRKLILVLRETPLNQIHLKNMLAASQAGATIVPASPAFYHNPQRVEDLVDFIVARVLDLLEIPQNLVPPWGSI